ncbi:hypothetical protein O988_03145 [Pseudogymnoascus sp. VKM F-3808]|nr:hypothetical protein O988_03145 [Pseudogymnoascus sp. VKM F-3808]
MARKTPAQRVDESFWNERYSSIQQYLSETEHVNNYLEYIYRRLKSEEGGFHPTKNQLVTRINKWLESGALFYPCSSVHLHIDPSPTDNHGESNIVGNASMLCGDVPSGDGVTFPSDQTSG